MRKKKNDKEFNGLIPRWFPGYKINKWIMRSALVLILFLGFLGAWFEGYSVKDFLFGSPYIECPVGENICVNPFYGDYAAGGVCKVKDFCDVPFLAPGQSLGHEPGFVTQNFGLFCFLLIVSAIILNHSLYNRGYEFKKKSRRVRI